MYDQFKTRAEGVSAEVHRFPTSAAALDFMVGFLRDEGVAETPGRYAVWADCPFLGGIDRQQLAGIAGLHFEVSRERAAEAHIGISQMDFALADTGTLAQDATAVDKRLVSTLPVIHIALVPTAALLPDLPAWLGKAQAQNSGYLSLITGPSRTADIERVLTIGVHGPSRLIIIFVDQLGGSN